MKINKTIILVLFFLLAMAQIYVPASMIMDREDILSAGKDFKFKTAPIDPNDPFRGKYITLRFDNTDFFLEDNDKRVWEKNEKVFAILKVDTSGFVFIKSVKKDRPNNNIDYLETQIKYVYGDYNYKKHTVKNAEKIVLDFPFNRYYMEESKAYDAELAYRNRRNFEKPAYALVSIKEGKSVLKDVIIDGISVKEIIVKQIKNKN